ncbi:MAG TPA: VanW family protein, partial [Patescibacteria group bacterium]|nr:VanW family protein [Patescibacteria group bacterium]
VDVLKRKLKNLDTSAIVLKTQEQEPRIHQKDCQGLKQEAEKILEKAPLKLLVPIEGRDNASREWTVNKSQLASWLQLQLQKNCSRVEIGLNKEEVGNFLEEAISPEVDQEPEEAKFEIKDGKVVKFKASQDGLELAVSTSSQKIEQELIRGTSTTSTQIKLLTRTVESKIKAGNINNMGIEEVIGVGQSDFSGSPANRVHNIEIGAKSLEGRLIKPGEEFSLVEALGKINAENGYKPELVIKGNKTIPEYGGGLCQIATTMFRTALQSGLKITERRNHSYRVSYYEPAGTDATIYPPHPDLRFINDTDNHILIQYRIKDSKLYFDFWGNDDGREVKVTEPTIYNLVNPGPTKIIESTELDPGKKRCTESAHTGADAYFDYKVNYSEEDKETKERRFYSHYVPWREVCLVGVEEPPKDSDGNKKEGATSTPSSTAAFFE